MKSHFNNQEATSFIFVFQDIKVDFSRAAGEATWVINGMYYLKSSSVQTGISVLNNDNGFGLKKSGYLPEGSGPMPPVNQPVSPIPARTK